MVSKESEKYKLKKNDVGIGLVSTHAITLISLVITIVILIILAGIVINLSIGENGLFRKAKQAKEQYSLSEAREKLETVLMEAVIEKETNENYNNAEFLDDMLERNNMEVNGENVIVDNYIFAIDREKLAVTKSLGESEIKITSEVQEYLGKNENGKYEASLLLVIESNTNLKNIIIKNPDGTTFEMKTEEEKIAKDLIVEFDEEYIITVTTNNGKEETRKIVEKTEEIIKNANELAMLRDKVNSGLTYEGKTIKLANDIDLGNVCGENLKGKEINWEPIGYWHTEKNNCAFKGNFNGEYNTIKNLYININENNKEKYDNDIESEEISVGLFGWSQGTIENLIMENVYIYVDTSDFSVADKQHQVIGAVAGTTWEGEGVLQNIGIKSGSITSINKAQTSIVNRQQNIGGIVGETFQTINNCYNNANISATNNGYYSSTIIYSNNEVGGIVGYYGEGNISNCYNTGKIEGNNARSNWIGGIIGYLNEGEVKNSYNYGEISGEGSYKNQDLLGGIVGRIKVNGGTITNSYCTKASAQYSYYYGSESNKYTTGIVEEETLKGYAGTLGDAFVSDGKKIDKEGNIIDNLDSDKNTKYINNGYPILKWQVTEI